MTVSRTSLVVLAASVSCFLMAASAFAESQAGTGVDLISSAPIIIQSAPSQPLVELAKPVEATALGEINPESVGLLAASEGGLGASLWHGTSRAMVEQLMANLRLPTSSFTLNALARRLLISTTAVPDGGSSISQSLPALRVTKLNALGDSDDAWKLSKLIKSDFLSEVALRQTLEATLVALNPAVNVCSLLPDIIKIHNGSDWQKILVVCQLRAKDTKAAQLSLDLLHTQDVKDDTFFALAEKNVIGESKQLPKQLSPLNPLTLALLQLTGLDVPADVFNHPEPSLIPALLHMPIKDEGVRLTLAEQAAEQGLISASDLETVYSNTSPIPVSAIKGSSVIDSAPYNRALLYQASVQETTMQGRIDAMEKYVQMAPPSLLTGAGGIVAADMVSIVPVVPDFYAAAPWMIRVDLLAGKMSGAMEWMKLVRQGSETATSVAADVQYLWPFLVFSGIESDHDYMSDRSHWLDMMLHSTGAQTDRLMHERAASVLLLFDASGLVVSDNEWVRVFGVTDSDAHDGLSAFVLTRLRAAALANKRGEVAMLSLLASNPSSEDGFYAKLEIIRALRSVGLVGDATALAREETSKILFPLVTH